jgi:hypothetical protein
MSKITRVSVLKQDIEEERDRFMHLTLEAPPILGMEILEGRDDESASSRSVSANIARKNRNFASKLDTKMLELSYDDKALPKLARPELLLQTSIRPKTSAIPRFCQLTVSTSNANSRLVERNGEQLYVQIEKYDATGLLSSQPSQCTSNIEHTHQGHSLPVSLFTTGTKLQAPEPSLKTENFGTTPRISSTVPISPSPSTDSSTRKVLEERCPGCGREFVVLKRHKCKTLSTASGPPVVSPAQSEVRVKQVASATWPIDNFIRDYDGDDYGNKDESLKDYSSDDFQPGSILRYKEEPTEEFKAVRMEQVKDAKGRLKSWLSTRIGKSIVKRVIFHVEDTVDDDQSLFRALEVGLRLAHFNKPLTEALGAPDVCYPLEELRHRVVQTLRACRMEKIMRDNGRPTTMMDDALVTVIDQDPRYSHIAQHDAKWLSYCSALEDGAKPSDLCCYAASKLFGASIRVITERMDSKWYTENFRIGRGWKSVVYLAYVEYLDLYFPLRAEKQ